MSTRFIIFDKYLGKPSGMPLKFYAEGDGMRSAKDALNRWADDESARDRRFPRSWFMRSYIAVDTKLLRSQLASRSSTSGAKRKAGAKTATRKKVPSKKTRNPAKKKRAGRPLREGQRVYHCAKRCR